ncbi:LacI family DNA-binding transcriptional regulator [Cohnella rhizosphaerae]|uniref:LacI family transcriptional regulator n=1 Tax=Cohnella rhizosphaerae TaxID=1457232 RepID=A0A9X4QT32_9BACL|nr:LacI family DNA-binding transcriptional regulator [Cohnella rhizosphaerae]MDG0810686.1 LacI family transcriptional regulator [Cohnella rhizosphaerae]
MHWKERASIEKITIKEIAELAGVNKATVSRVLNGNANISARTRDKVMEIVKRHNYVPNALAKGLASNRTYTVGFCYDYTEKQAVSNPFFQTVLQGVEDVVYARNFLFLMMSMQRDQLAHSSFAKVVTERRIDGVLVPTQLFTEATHRLLRQEGMPFVVVGEPMISQPDVHWVDIDNVQASEKLTRRLLDQGLGDVRIVYDEADKVRDKFVLDRIEGYKRAMGASRLKPREATLPQVEEAFVGEAETVPQALIFSTESLLFDWLDTAASYPQAHSIRLATFDRSPFHRHMKYAVEAIEIELEAMGTEAADMLFALIDKNELAQPYIKIPSK